MKTLTTFTLALLFAFSAPTFAGEGASALGPWVNCELSNGKVDYQPLHSCTQNGGHEVL
ncbi:hypothetical protein [Thaumasiovibrio subtropicus]|uniref:hypothetical protein n=1 Tax=Thaumasiovibrio subtropicus TaxID=1891207 RepID=UPI001863A49E|nr:hypothetical protein [Thaumasiovibrio subtropicus]